MPNKPPIEIIINKLSAIIIHNKIRQSKYSEPQV